MRMQNFHPTAADLRLGFHISPDITIALVRSKPEPTTTSTTHQVSEPAETNDDEECDEKEYESEDEFDPDFHPLVFCTTTMDDDEKKEEMPPPHESRTNPHYPALLAALCKQSKKSSVRSTHSNENSSLVCNVGESQAGGAKPKKRFTCHICLKTFGWTTDLKRHILIHTGERPFKCSLCMATFTRNFLLQKHKTKVHQCLSPNEASQLTNNVAKNVMEIKLKMRELEEAKGSNTE